MPFRGPFSRKFHGMLRNVTESRGMSRNVAECRGMSRNVAECRGMFQTIFIGIFY
jgi:hypothetical protein